MEFKNHRWSASVRLVAWAMMAACAAESPVSPGRSSTALVALSATPSAIVAGQSSSLSWIATDVASCLGSWDLSAALAIKGSANVSPISTTTYRVTCTGSAGNTSDSVTVSVVPATGTLSLTITGLPIGVQADVRITGANSFSGMAFASSTLPNLPPGAFTITAQSVMASGVRYIPTPPSQTATVSASATASAMITYVSVPVAPAPTVTVSASASPITAGQGLTIRWTSTNASSCEGSWSGSATLTPNGSQLFNPTTTTTYAVVCTGGGGSARDSITVPVLATTGTLSLTITGLPSGIQADVHVTGPSSFSGTVFASSTFANVALGLYTITAKSVTAGGVNYVPTPASQTATVDANATATATVAYAAVPVAPAPTVTVSASTAAITAGQSVTITWASTNATSCGGSWAGGATLAPNGSQLFNPTTTTSYTVVCTGSGGRVSNNITISVMAASGTLNLTIAGLPSGVQADVHLTGPNSFSGTAVASSTFSNMALGPYTITAQSVTLGAATYAPAPAIQTTPVSANATASVMVTYALTSTFLPAPALLGPSDGATSVSLTPTFSWSPVQGANRYWLLVARSPNDLPADPNSTSCPACTVSGNTTLTSHTLPNPFPNTSGGGNHASLVAGTVYFWKVQAWNSNGAQGLYSTSARFTTQSSGQFRLTAFPLPNRTEGTAVINSVFDHSMTSAYTADGVVVAYTGETGSRQYGQSYVSTVKGILLYGFKNGQGNSFSVGGRYSGGAYLYYDGHSGIDFKTTDQAPSSGVVNVLAAASGTAHYINGSVYNTIYIDHGAGYTTHYLHLSQRIIADGQTVQAGQLIGRSGDFGVPGSPHLHFEVQLNGIPIDPYGWTGAGVDPYTRATNRGLW